MKKLQMLLVFLCIGIGLAMAQTSTITGVVVSSEDNEPVIGASVLVKGTTQDAITDLNGAFSIPNIAAKAKTLVVSYIGMRTVEVAIKPNMRIVLHPDTQVLDEVVVTVAYGSAKKSSLTGAISSINTKQIESRPVSIVTSALEGATSGVQVNSTYGAPGSEPSILIRGIGTVNGDVSPLYVVDGMPMGGNISDLNPSDIESISVLKDAGSAALYGNRALSRNRVIHALGLKTLVAQSSLKTGGTWDGTVRNLRFGYSPVFCYGDGSEAVGMLTAMGAVSIGMEQLKDFYELENGQKNLFDR